MIMTFISCRTTDWTSWSSPEPADEEESADDLTRATCGIEALGNSHK